MIRAGRQSLGDGSYVQRVVALADVEEKFAASVAVHKARASIMQAFKRYSNSLEAVLREPQCAAAVRMQRAGGVLRLLACVDKLLGQDGSIQFSSTAAAAPAEEEREGGGGEGSSKTVPHG